MRSVVLFCRSVALALLIAVAGCSPGPGEGLLVLNVTADATVPVGAANKVVLLFPGEPDRTYAGAFPRDNNAPLVLQFPNLPAGQVTITVRASAADGCTVAEASKPVTVEGGARTSADIVLARSIGACSDGGAQPDAPPEASDVLVVADRKDLPPSSPETVPDLPAPKDGPVAYDVTMLDVTAVDATDATANDVADAPFALDTTVDTVAVDQGSAPDGARQGLDAQTVDLSALPVVTSFPCRNDDDCCTTVDICMAKVYLYSQGPGGSSPTIPPSTGMCLACMTPAIQVTCVSGQCMGTKVSGYPRALLESHCGTLSLTDVGTHAPMKMDAGAPTTKSVWSCGE